MTSVQFTGLQGGATGVVETSAAGAQTAVVTLSWGSGGHYDVAVTSPGTNYAAGDKIKILGTALGGATPANDCTLTALENGGDGMFKVYACYRTEWVASKHYMQAFPALQGGTTGVTETSTSGENSAVFTVSNAISGDYIAATTTPGSNYAAGDKIKILGTALGGATPANDATLTAVLRSYTVGGIKGGIDGIVETSTNGAATHVFTIVNYGSSTYYSRVSTYGTNYAAGDTVVIPGTVLGGSSPANDCTLTAKDAYYWEAAGTPPALSSITSGAGTTTTTWSNHVTWEASGKSNPTVPAGVTIPMVSASALKTCVEKVSTYTSAGATSVRSGFLYEANNAARIGEICDPTNDATGLGSCLALFDKVKQHYVDNKMLRCTFDMMSVTAIGMICIKDDANAWCPFSGYDDLYKNMPSTKVFSSNAGYLEECGAAFTALQGGVSGTVETSANGANSAIIKVTNLGDKTYTIEQTTEGTNYLAGDTIVVKGSQLGSVDGTNDCTATASLERYEVDLLQGGVSGTVDDSAGGANSAIFKVSIYSGSDKYDAYPTTYGNGGYAAGDKIKILGTALGGATPANDCTLTAQDGYSWTTTGTPVALATITPTVGAGYPNHATYVRWETEGLSAPIDATAVDKCFNTAMDLMCSPCAAKSAKAATAYMMGLVQQFYPASLPLYEMYGKLNSVACMKSEVEGYCVTSYGKTNAALQDRNIKGGDNPYCDPKQRCPKRFMAAYTGIFAANPTNSAAMMEQQAKMLDFACIINPENKDYCMDMMQGSGGAPWETANCKKVAGLETSPWEGAPPFVVPSKETFGAAGDGTACANDLVGTAAEYGCCLTSVATTYFTGTQKPYGTFMTDIFTNAGAVLKPACDMMAAKGEATLTFTGVTAEWLKENEKNLKTDVCASAGLPNRAIENITYATVVEDTRRRLGASLHTTIAAEHHRRLASTKAVATIVYGTQEDSETSAATTALASSFEPTTLQQEAKLDGTDMSVTSAAVVTKTEAVPKKKSRLGAWADWMHQDCPTAEEDGNPWWCATVVLIGSGALAVTVVVAAIGIVIAIVVVKKKNAAEAAAFEDEGNKKTVVSGTVVEMTNPANDI